MNEPLTAAEFDYRLREEVYLEMERRYSQIPIISNAELPEGGTIVLKQGGCEIARIVNIGMEETK